MQVESFELCYLVCFLPALSFMNSFLQTNVGYYFIPVKCVSILFCSLIQFFNKIKKWADMANLPESFRSKVDKLERKFSVSTVIFKKYKPIFISVFKDPDLDPPKLPRSRKQRFVCLFSRYFVERTFIVMQLKFLAIRN